MTSELRPALEVWTDAEIAACHGAEYAAAAVIEADRQATRAALVSEIVEWLRDDDTVWSILKGADQYALATEIEAKWGKQ